MQFIKLTNSDKISSEIVSIIKAKLLDGSLKNGDKLPTESEMIEQLGVSRTPVREAIKMQNRLVSFRLSAVEVCSSPIIPLIFR